MCLLSLGLGKVCQALDEPIFSCAATEVQPTGALRWSRGGENSVGAEVQTKARGLAGRLGFTTVSAFQSQCSCLWLLLVSRNPSSQQTNHGTHPENLILARKRNPLQIIPSRTRQSLTHTDRGPPPRSLRES